MLMMVALWVLRWVVSQATVVVQSWVEVWA
jgi:hypothetical protein